MEATTVNEMGAKPDRELASVAVAVKFTTPGVVPGGIMMELVQTLGVAESASGAVAEPPSGLRLSVTLLMVGLEPGVTVTLMATV